MDGVTIGHPRCHVYHCTERLQSPRDRHCPKHRDFDSQCAIKGCSRPVSDGKRTCDTPSHRGYENSRRQQGQALFELKRRLAARSVASHIRSLPSQPPTQDVLDDPEIQSLLDDPAVPSNVQAKSKDAEKKMKSTLTRKWTHNEQLLVRPCGVIVARATFFEAESPSNCRVSQSASCSPRANGSIWQCFLHAAFPDLYPRSLPCYNFFDNNCQLLQHIRSCKDKRLLKMCYPVDVFHAQNKHKGSDIFCQTHCNPALFPELMGEGGDWAFNSSIAEQTNVWVGKFLPIVREMSEVHFNFFLDEMMDDHNEQKVTLLERRGRRPRLIPLEELALPRN